MIGTGGHSRARGQVVPAGLYKTQEPARQFANPILLATADGLRRNQFPAHAQGDCPRNDKIGRVLLIHAPGGHKRNLRVHSME